jgi:glycosyltransferase involved in cell wall biosynthesis
VKFTIITPTVQRESLRRCCESVAIQTHEDREHIIVIDGPELKVPLLEGCFYPKQRWIATGKAYRNGGNTPRHIAWDYATGDWIYYLDCDNYLADPNALSELASSLEGVEEQWALVPIFRHGSLFFFDPPQPCYFDTGNAVARRAIAQWPNIDGYASDAVWLMDTLLKHPYKAFPKANPIMVMPTTSFGVGGGINGQ